MAPLPATTSSASSAAAAAASMPKQWHYLTPQGAANIVRYKYSGSDASLLYRFVVSPTAQYVVDHLMPPCVAPNTITIAGLLAVVLAHLCMLWYSPDMAQDAPTWVYVLAGVSLMVYQVLDAADGKQARKTGNSSPLGLLFDHGCDAYNVIASACTFAATLQLGPTYWSLLLFVGPATVFFLATWEEYYTGTLALPPINGANEGLAIMYTLYLWTAYAGPSFWREPNAFVPSLQNNHAFVIFTIGSATIQCLISVIIVLRSVKRKHPTQSLLAPLIGIIPLLALMALSALWVLRSPANVFAAHPRLFMWTVGLQFVKMTMHVMLAHMCQEPYRLLRKTFSIQLAIAFALVVGVLPFGHEETVVKVFFALSAAAYTHLACFAVLDLATLLDIHVFRVKKTPAKKID